MAKPALAAAGWSPEEAARYELAILRGLAADKMAQRVYSQKVRVMEAVRAKAKQQQVQLARRQPRDRVRRELAERQPRRLAVADEHELRPAAAAVGRRAARRVDTSVDCRRRLRAVATRRRAGALHEDRVGFALADGRPVVASGVRVGAIRRRRRRRGGRGSGRGGE